MAEESRFLLGYGERLTKTIEPQGGGGDKKLPYNFEEARSRLTGMVTETARDLRALPEDAFPKDQAIVAVTMHPQFLAKSYFPDGLLRATGLEAVGSRPTRVRPEKWTRKGPPTESETTDLFLLGSRTKIYNWSKELPQWTRGVRGASDIQKLERVRAPAPSERIRGIEEEPGPAHLEIVLHLPDPDDAGVLEDFRTFLSNRGATADLDRRLVAGGLCFLPVTADPERIEALASFSLLRVIRSVPRLRAMVPSVRISMGGLSFSALLPEGQVDRDLRAAVFDGGLPEDHGMERWVDSHEIDVGPPVPAGLTHGAQVTSALLFGPLRDGVRADRPVCGVDHYRVLDSKSEEDPFELFDVLQRIKKVLATRSYAFINLSIGPRVPIEDDEVHTWACVLDDLLADGETLLFSAVGNDGDADWESGNARVQVPSDSVNTIAVGAADRSGTKWERAGYSSVGPGRSPGLVKPDILAFGGSTHEPFWTLDPLAPPAVVPAAGTSFATPEALRMALGLRAHFGEVFSPLAIKALLVDASEDNGFRRECGWGRIPDLIDDAATCSPGVVRVLYQGELTPAEYMRAPIPIPAKTLSGKVTVSATIVYASQVDPQDPGNYTRSGLDVVFRPHADKFREGATYPKSSHFFQLKEFSEEQELRKDAHKWETTLHRSRRMYGTSLKDPVFDIHYNSRLGGANSRVAGPIKYAMVVSIDAPKVPDLYTRVLARYPTILVPLRPRIELPLRSSA